MVVACGHSWICIYIYIYTQKWVSHSSSWFFSENSHPLHPLRRGGRNKNFHQRWWKNEKNPPKNITKKKRWKMKELSPIPPKKKTPKMKKTANFFRHFFFGTSPWAARERVVSPSDQKNPHIFYGNLRCPIPPNARARKTPRNIAGLMKRGREKWSVANQGWKKNDTDPDDLALL